MGQLTKNLDGITAEQARSIVIAYEPIWAIGTGEVATPEDAQEVCSAIRTLLADLYSGDLADGVRVLSGGPVKSSHVAATMAKEDVDGPPCGGGPAPGGGQTARGGPAPAARHGRPRAAREGTAAGGSTCASQSAKPSP